MVASILVCHRSYLINAAVSHSQCITNSVCDLYQCSDVCMRQMFEEAEETEAMNEWIIGLTKRSYRYRILSPVICLLSPSYLARQKYTLSHTAGVCMNVEPLQIILLFNFFVLHLDRLLLFVRALVVLLLCMQFRKGSSAVFCVIVAVDARQGTAFDTECTWVYANTTWSLIQARAVPVMRSHAHTNTCTLSSLCPTLDALTTIKRKDAKCFSPCFLLCEFAVSMWRKERASARTHTYTYIQLRARNTLGCWIMRVDRAELSLHITIILSSSQLPQHLPWRCDISILLEFNLSPPNKTIAYRPFPNWPSPILITWN